MPVRDIDGVLAIIRLELSPGEIPPLLQRHSRQYPGAQEVEEVGVTLSKAEFPPTESVEFVRRVCRWGGGDRLIGRVTDTGGARISAALREAVRLADRGQVPEAVSEVQNLPYLGQSFASKQLRFLRPSAAVILDSVIRNNLGYAASRDGYAAFLADCRAILEKAEGLAQPDGRPLRVCDVEAAIFAKLQGF